tara:strand:- start:2 stop:208 length:207 start_codon:yes stop_codon:yes gene_type:complete
LQVVEVVEIDLVELEEQVELVVEVQVQMVVEMHQELLQELLTQVVVAVEPVKTQVMLQEQLLALVVQV